MTRIPALGPNGEGWLALQLGLIGLVVVAAISGPSIPVGSREADVLRALGALALVGGVLVISSAGTLLRRAGSFRALPRPTRGGDLVDSGPYRYVRHPIYAGLILACLGAAVYQRSLLVAALTAALAIVLDLKRRREEAWLVIRHPHYPDYQARTRALIPLVY